MQIDQLRANVIIPDGTTIAVTGGSLTYDEGWAPFIQASVTIPTPSNVAQLDPRTAARVTLQIIQTFSDSDPVSTFTTQFGAGTVAALTTAFGSGTVAAITAAHNRAWAGNSTKPPQTRTMTLGIREWSRDDSEELTLTLAGDEALLQDFSPAGNEVFSTDSGNLPGWNPTQLSGLVKNVLAFANVQYQQFSFDPAADANLFGSFVPNTITATPELVMPVDSNVWDFLAPYLTQAGSRLWSDETRAWYLTKVPNVVAGSVAIAAGTNLKAFTESASREGEWGNRVRILYQKNVAGTPVTVGMDQASSAIVGQPVKQVIIEQYITGAVPAAGGAALLLARLANRAHELTVTALADLSATPGMATTITLPGVAAQSGYIASVVYNFDTADMIVVARDLT